jgi:hypothetical protein
MLANTLLEQETLDAEEIAALMEGKPLTEIHTKRANTAKKNADEDAEVAARPAREVTAKESTTKKEPIQVMINEKKIES